MESQSLTAKRTGGRSALVFASVRSAVEELVKERGSERVTVPMIAERAGVNPTSIYRRWGDLPTLINDIATYRLDPSRSLPDSGTLREDLTAWANEIVAHYSKPVNAALLRGGAATAGDSESDCLRNRRIEATAFIDREQRRGGTFDDEAQAAEHPFLTVDDVIDHVVAPIVYRVIFAPWTLDENSGAKFVDNLFATL
jgi:AcrR family transcriptional regulator